MRTIIIISIVSPLLCAACQKGGKAHVEGYIYKAGTTIPIQHARIDLIETHNANQGEWSHQMYSDDNGYYKISYFIRFNKNYRYYVMISPERGYQSQTRQMKHNKERYDFYFP